MIYNWSKPIIVREIIQLQYCHTEPDEVLTSIKMRMKIKIKTSNISVNQRNLREINSVQLYA